MHNLEYNLEVNRTNGLMLGINVERDLCIKCLWLTIPANVPGIFVSKQAMISTVKVRGSQFLNTKNLGQEITGDILERGLNN